MRLIQEVGMVWQSLRQRLVKSSNALSQKLSGMFRGSAFTPQQWEALEDELITWDLGVRLSQEICDWLRHQKMPQPPSESIMRALLAQHLKTLLAPYQKSLTPHPQPGAPWIVLMVGSNGGGKTTTVGKLAHLWSQNYRVRVAAADTFRAAASEQLAVWAKRSSVAITLGTPQEDPASVAVRALQEAVSSGEDILLVDTAGRLSNKEELLQELAKIHRVLQRQHIRYASEGYERLLVLDATTGQNVLAQAEAFQKTVPLTGCILNKLDGTAKGGTLFALTQALHLPIVGIGTGESADDFSWFQSDAFVDALLPME